MNAPQTAHTGETLSPDVRYDDWRTRIRMASDLDQLVRIVREYLATWRPDQLARLPVEIAVTGIFTCTDIAERAVVAAQADLKWNGEESVGSLMREMALTLGAAASRIRFLVGGRSVENAIGESRR
ncbi:MAG TPA: hypothetical protein VLS49_01460 [Usitatibacter sp.]|nr:hypothetical protein [Usitatibacter sp.]